MEAPMSQAHHRGTWMFCGALLLLLSQTSCQDSRSLTGSDEDMVVAAIDRFPQAVGTRWLYSMKGRQWLNIDLVDTVEVRIVRLVEITDTSRTWLWRYRSLTRNFEWTDYHVTIAGNRVSLKPQDGNPYAKYVMLEFPLIQDSTWFSVGLVSLVTAADTLAGPLGTLVTQPVYSYEKTRCLSCVHSFAHWYAPDVGFVRIVHKSLGGGYEWTYQDWQLLEWDPAG